MSISTMRPRALALTAAAASALVLAPAVTAARTSTFYACVKKNGTARISTRKLRCAKHETKMSWSARGPAGRNGAKGSDGLSGAKGADGLGGANGASGKDGASGANGVSGTDGVNGKDGVNGTNGTNGTNGIDGANGAVAGFATAPMAEGVMFTSASEGSPQTIVSMALPAGSFIANAKVEVLLSDTKAGGRANVECRLVDAPAGGGSGVFDTSGWAALIDFPFIAVDLAQSTIPLTLAVNSPTHPSTLSAVCWVGVKEVAGGTLTAEASNASITAVQTSSNS
ncbi:MAG TPA: hypothetical protein VG366_01910 [Solirubrobacteraceae bacterium]|jgi:hypothetical protein|nr:hypothetical protein [Solirubrobacteraceae bacterium]